MATSPSTQLGRLRIFLGYAAGVGKTYKMLEAAQRMQRCGLDVVIGYFEPHSRPDTIALTVGLEAVPRREVVYRGLLLTEMDTDAILRRRPAVCVVDELPHTNAPGSARAKRWEDVRVLLAAGIDVLTTMNVQHLESLNDQVKRVSGIQVRETIPDWFVQRADEIVMVDLTPRALIHRLQRGVVYPAEKAQRALDNFFQEPTLGALRELAMRQTAHVLEYQQEEAAEAHGVEAARGEPNSEDRILVAVTDDPATAIVIRRARRVADYYHSECFAAYVPAAGDDAATVERHLRFALNLRLETHTLAAGDVALALVAFARERKVTQIFCARPRPRSQRFGRDTLVQRLVRLAPDMQVTIVAQRVAG